MKTLENGWHIKSEGYMTPEPAYQKLSHKRVADAIECGRAVTFAHVIDGVEDDSEIYVASERADALRNLLYTMMTELRHWEPALYRKYAEKARELEIEV